MGSLPSIPESLRGGGDSQRSFWPGEASQRAGQRGRGPLYRPFRGLHLWPVRRLSQRAAPLGPQAGAVAGGGPAGWPWLPQRDPREHVTSAQTRAGVPGRGPSRQNAAHLREARPPVTPGPPGDSQVSSSDGFRLLHVQSGLLSQGEGQGRKRGLGPRSEATGASQTDRRGSACSL